VIYTTYVAGSLFISQALKDATTGGIILDEVVSERDNNWYPVLATRYSRDPFLVMVGDDKQLPPYVFTPDDQSAYKSEHQCSMFVRLIKVGFPVGKLLHQTNLSTVSSIRGWTRSGRTQPETLVSRSIAKAECLTTWDLCYMLGNGMDSRETRCYRGGL